MTYEKLLKFCTDTKTSTNVMVVSVETDLRIAQSTIDMTIKNNEQGTSSKLDSSGKNTSGNILTMKLDKMSSVEIILYHLGKKLATDLREVTFRSGFSNRNTKALIRGIMDVDVARVELILKKTVEMNNGLPASTKCIEKREFNSKGPEFKMLEDLRAFKFKNEPNKESYRTMLHEASLLCNSVFQENAGIAIFIGENKRGDDPSGGKVYNKVDSNAKLRALCLENRIPFRHSNVIDLYPLMGEVMMN